MRLATQHETCYITPLGNDHTWGTMAVWHVAAARAALGMALCGACVPASFAQSRDATDVLTLERAVALALQANPKLDNARLDVQKASASSA